jgi:hypothetical protein
MAHAASSIICLRKVSATSFWKEEVLAASVFTFF